MSSILRLSGSYFHCPPCWKNFIDNIINNGHDWYIHKPREVVPTEVIDSALGKYKAIYLEKTATVPCVIFEDDKLKTLFILEWS
jgi:hypothetical protein